MDVKMNYQENILLPPTHELRPSVARAMEEYGRKAVLANYDRYRAIVDAAQAEANACLQSLVDALRQSSARHYVECQRLRERVAELEAQLAAQPVPDSGAAPASAQSIYEAVLSCPHVIDQDAVRLQFDRRLPGKNALDQLHSRINQASKKDAQDAARYRAIRGPGLEGEEMDVDIDVRIAANMVAGDLPTTDHIADVSNMVTPRAGNARELLAAIAAKIDHNKPHAPGHDHLRPGIWDDDNAPSLAGKPCEWCATWALVRAEIAGNGSADEQKSGPMAQSAKGASS